MASGRPGQYTTPSLFPDSEPSFPSSADDRAWNLLALSRVRGLGIGGLRLLYDSFSNLTEIWHTSPDTLFARFKEIKLRDGERIAGDLLANRDQYLEAAAREMSDLNARGIALLTDRDPEFSDRLRKIPAAPRWLFAHGNVSLLNRKSSIAVVGTREPSEEGRRAAYQFASLLAERGYVVVSGLAEGIDTAAHTAAVDTGGDTVAVLGHGLGVEFPASNRDLRQRIVDSGGVVATEYFVNQSFSRQTFVQRNRIIAGLAAALVPIESRLSSGTSHAVTFAQTFGRDVFGVKEGTVNPWNEMGAALEARGQMFDLLPSASSLSLTLRLSQYGDDQRPADRNHSGILKRRYATALRALRQAVKHSPLDADGRAWLLQQVEQIAMGEPPENR